MMSLKEVRFPHDPASLHLPISPHRLVLLFSPADPAWVPTENCVARSKCGVVKLQEQTPGRLRIATKEEMAPMDQ
jgi:hypothetical protein